MNNRENFIMYYIICDINYIWIQRSHTNILYAVPDIKLPSGNMTYADVRINQ